MELIKSIILGIIQGLTEFLPVSSSGHIQIASELLKLDFGQSGNLLFTVAVHAATTCSTIIVFRKELLEIFKNLLKFKWDNNTKFVLCIIISMIPVAIVGLFFKDTVETFFNGELIYVGLALLVSASLLIMSQIKRVKTEKEITPIKAFIVGLAQAIAVLPGLSRSGATISTGLLLGINRKKIAKFSFLMVIIPILGETFLDLIKGDFSAELSNISIEALICGFIAAFLSGIFACKAMISLVSKKKLHYFAIYCSIVGIIIIISYLLKINAI